MIENVHRFTAGAAQQPGTPAKRLSWTNYPNPFYSCNVDVVEKAIVSVSMIRREVHYQYTIFEGSLRGQLPATVSRSRTRSEHGTL